MKTRGSYLIQAGMVVGLALLPAIVLAAGTGFVPLSNIPALTDTAGAPNISSFLNQLYKICIGIAVVLAVVQLIRAGITYMTAAGNVGSVDGAKKLIWSSLLGLLLVLSPVIVFTTINPQILTLSINTSDITNIPTTNANPTMQGTSQPNAAVTNFKQNDQLIQCAQDTCDPAINQCTKVPGSSSRVCKNLQTGDITDAHLNMTCDYGTTNYIKCTPFVKQSQKCTGLTYASCPALQCTSGTLYHVCVDKSTGAESPPGTVGHVSETLGLGLSVCPDTSALVVQCI